MLHTPTRLPACPHCENNLFVRVEWVLSGRRVSSAYYCGRCNHEWLVETSPPEKLGERRRADRRRQFRVQEKAEV